MVEFVAAQGDGLAGMGQRINVEPAKVTGDGDASYLSLRQRVTGLMPRIFAATVRFPWVDLSTAWM
jgi:hypothetical protein